MKLWSLLAIAAFPLMGPSLASAICESERADLNSATDAYYGCTSYYAGAWDPASWCDGEYRMMDFASRELYYCYQNGGGWDMR